MQETEKELRRIRIALVFIAIFIMLSGGDHTVEIVDDPYQEVNHEQSNMVPLGDGYFGVLRSDSDDITKYLEIYFYDKEQNKLKLVKEDDLWELSEQ